MKVLIVVAHPLAESLCSALAQSVIEVLKARGHDLRVENLYEDDFHPALTRGERRTYYSALYDSSAIQASTDNLLWAEGLILVFPTWWFGPPAILKGWFDRVWGPGIAFDHAKDLGLIKPRLHQLRRALAITSLGSPWWVDYFVMRQPVKRVIKTGIVGACAPRCRLEMLTLYGTESLVASKVRAFTARIGKVLSAWPSELK